MGSEKAMLLIQPPDDEDLDLATHILMIGRPGALGVTLHAFAIDSLVPSETQVEARLGTRLIVAFPAGVWYLRIEKKYVSFYPEIEPSPSPEPNLLEQEIVRSIPGPNPNQGYL